MKLILIAILFCTTSCVTCLANQIRFVQNSSSYLVQCNDQDYQMLKGDSYFKMEGDSVLTCAIDSVATVLDQSDSLFIFIEGSRSIAYCYKQNGRLYFADIQYPDYGRISDFYYMDMNNDGKTDYITVLTDAEGFSIIVRIFFSARKCFIDEYFKYFDHYHGDIEKQVKVRGKKIYILYGYSFILHDRQLMKYGFFDYTRDRSREIYFKPLSITTKEKWDRLSR